MPFFGFQLMVGTPHGVTIHHVVPPVVEVCSRKQDHALLLPQQTVAETAAYLDQAQNRGTAVLRHVRVSSH